MPMFQTNQIDELAARAVFGPKRKASGKNGVAVSSHPIVTRVATEVLRAGGNAVDAALAASAAQTVVEPHMTTIFGVLSLMHHDAATGATTYLNGSMNAPKAGLPGFGAPSDFTGGRAVAVPGFWAAWEAARERYGSWSSEKLLAPAIELARTGFPIYPFLYGMMFEQAGKIGLFPEGREIYYTNGALKNPGERLVQNRLADTLEQLAVKGHDYFYRSEFTQRVVDQVKAIGGVLTMEDFDAYEVRWMEPAWGDYRGHKIAGSPPPDNGGTHLIEILNLIELIPLKEWGPPTESADTLYWLARFCNDVFLDGRNQRDPKSWHLPLETILSKEYAKIRFDLMQMGEAKVPGKNDAPYPGSNHLTVVDAQGNVATVLHSVMSMPWTSGLIVDGVSIWAGGVHFLRQMPKPGDRGSCYVAPHIIFGKDGKPLIAAGSPSIGLVPNCVQNALNLIDFGLDIEASVHRPRVGGLSLGSMMNPLAPEYSVEQDCGTPAIHDAVRAKGLRLDVVSPWSFHAGSYEGIHMPGGGLAEACADPRRAGAAEAV
jgi:gamma-glutamyltranspeptidase/glutathione hydrolase